MQEIGDPNDAPLTLHRAPEPSEPIHDKAAVAGAGGARAVAIPFNVKLEVYKEIAQSILTARTNARSIESGVTAFLPLASIEVRDKLLRIQGHAEQISKVCEEIYNMVAVQAFNN